MNRFVIPLVGFIALVALLAVGLGLNPREVPSPLIGKPAPDFSLPTVARGTAAGPDFSPRDMAGKVWLLNVWASWCISCREEHAQLVDMAANPAITLVGLNYKEVRGDAAIDADKLSPEAERKLALERANGWLTHQGNPYALSVLDLDGRVGIDYGVYGVPETYVIDKRGTIRFKHIGPITREVFATKILPLVGELNR